MKKSLELICAIAILSSLQPAAWADTLHQEQLDNDFELKQLYFGIKYPWQMLEPWDEAMIRISSPTPSIAPDLTSAKKSKKKLAGKNTTKKKAKNTSDVI
ncbi:MAG: hypothetical protein K8F91_17450 [Candidatus Obscuribacterales bacterium]|nr:hypothetical protein [Candidatus Obscuribacterales bacterium]